MNQKFFTSVMEGGNYLPQANLSYAENLQG